MKNRSCVDEDSPVLVAPPCRHWSDVQQADGCLTSPRRVGHEWHDAFGPAGD
jgi:hypothetical protein